MNPVTPAVLFFLATSALAADQPAATATVGEKHFSFPAEYTLQVAAAPPLIERPIEACFDDRGGLYVTESSGSNDPAAKQLETKPHRVLRLTDTDGDGVFDQRTVFADGLMFPEGCLWLDGALYVSAAPQIWKFTDADGDGVAEKREVWFDGKTLTGCANDLHGPYAGPDGWIYWCKGAFAEQTYDLPGQPGWKTRASHVFRARPDGSGLESVFTAGMDNPVGLAWTPEGELIVAGTFLQDPANGRRDGLIHAVYGGVWGKAHDVLNGHPRTGGLMPPMTHLGPAAPCGIARYGRDLLVTQFNLRTVSRHVLVPEGATYRTEDTDLLTCDHADFHPTDVLQAPDGSVLVLDTGGWYKLCCPTSQLAKPNVPGAIYRLRRKAGEMPVSSPPPTWTVGDPADAATQLSNLKAPDAHVRRRAAEALGRAHERAAVPELLTALAAPDVDRFLFHSLTYALLEIGDASATRRGLASASPAVQAGALFALAQMPGENLSAAEVLAVLDSPDPRLQEAGSFVIARHREWAKDVAPWIGRRIASLSEDDAALRELLKTLGGEPAMRALLADLLFQNQKAAVRDFVLRAMAETGGKELSPEWRNPLMTLLSGDDERIATAVLSVLAAAPPRRDREMEALLQRLALDDQRAPALRLAALAQRARGPLEPQQFAFVLAQARAGVPAAARLLALAKLTTAQQIELAPSLSGAGLLERPLLLKAFAGATDETVGRALLASLQNGSTFGALSPDAVAEAFAGFPESVRKELKAAEPARSSPEQRARVEELEKSLPAGDAEHGSVVFQSAKALCSTCHPVGYKGGHLGPDLSKIGAVRTRRDLIEAIAFPSASFARSYETVRVTRTDGSEVYGIVTNQSADSLTIATAPSVPPTAIPRAEIQALAPATFSLMPQGLDQVLTSSEFADVIAFLQSRK